MGCNFSLSPVGPGRLIPSPTSLPHDNGGNGTATDSEDALVLATPDSRASVDPRSITPGPTKLSCLDGDHNVQNFLQEVFCQPPKPVLPSLELQQAKWTSDASTAAPRRSRRLASKVRSVLTAKMAEELLTRRLGYCSPQSAEVPPDAVKQFIKLFDEPLPHGVISALRSICRLDGEDQRVVEALAPAPGVEPAIQDV